MEDRGWGDIQFITEQFRLHYRSSAKKVEPPQDLKRREFGFLSFGGKMMLRHISFDDAPQMRRYLAENAPAHAYYSSAYYSEPEEEMERKGWLGADLVFDIDADHIETPCKADHDRWACRGCGEKGGGKTPERCPSCGKMSFEEETWICDRCLESAKYEAQKLLDILIQDFGFTASKELAVNFTGNRGYHIHVTSPRAQKLDQLARREVVDYVMGTGVEAEFQGFGRMQGGEPALSAWGWRGRSARALYDYLTDTGPEAINDLKLTKTSAQILLENRDTMLAILRESHPSGLLKYVDAKSLSRLMEAAVRGQASAVDTVVTTDLHRLIRVPNTLNGKTGWLAQRVEVDELEDYDPTGNAIVFSGAPLRVYVRSSPRFRLGGETYGPFENESVELPPAAAILLICKMAARLER